MRPTLLVAVAFLAAGCLVPSTPAPPGATVPATAAFAKVVAVVDARDGQGEPSLGVAPDGALFTNGAGGSGSVYKSTDAGAHWTKLGTPTSPWPNLDSDLAVSRDGVVWYDNLWIGCSTVAVSRDGGGTWSSTPLACVPPAGDRQYVIPTTPGVAYIYSHHLPESYQVVAKTTDYGATWVPSGSGEGLGNTGASDWGGGGFWNAKTGSVFLTFTYFDDVVAAQLPQPTTKWHPAVGVSRDEGRTWSLVEVPNKGGFPDGALSLTVGAADLAGNVYLAWGEANGDDTAIYLAVSRDDGTTWSPPIHVDDTPNSKVMPAITANAAGHVAVAYYQADERAYSYNVSPKALWHVEVAWTTDALAATPSFQHAQLSKTPVHKGPVCEDGTLCQHDRELLDYFSLKTLPDGRVASVWTSTEDAPGKTVNVFGSTTDALLVS